MFNPIEINIDWGFLFGFISVLSLILTWIIKKLKRSNKEIIVKDVYVSSILLKPNELENNIKILINDIEIDSLNQTKLYLMNSGHQFINNDDFFIRPTIDLRGYTNILNVSISSSHEFTKIETKKIGESKIELEVNDFEPKSYIKIDLTFESIGNDYNPNLELCLKGQKKVNIDLKLIEMDRHRSITSDFTGILAISGGIFVLVLLLTSFIVKYGFGVNLDNPENFSIGWKFVFFGPATVIVISFLILFYKKINHWHFGLQKIKKWYNK